MVQLERAVEAECRGVAEVSTLALRGLGLVLTCDLGVIVRGFTPRGVVDGEADRFKTRVGDGALSRLVSTTAGLDSGVLVSMLADTHVEGGGKLLESVSELALSELSTFFFSRST